MVGCEVGINDGRAVGFTVGYDVGAGKGFVVGAGTGTDVGVRVLITDVTEVTEVTEGIELTTVALKLSSFKSDSMVARKSSGEDSPTSAKEATTSKVTSHVPDNNLRRRAVYLTSKFLISVSGTFA
jgi:hypothetical protein